LIPFTNGQVRIFDVKPYLSQGVFKELRNIVIFKSVKPVLGSIQWKNGQDFCPDTLYLESKLLRKLQQRTVKGRQRGLHA
jgi:hypothetical protein